MKYEELSIIYQSEGVECGEIPQDEWEKICQMAGDTDV